MSDYLITLSQSGRLLASMTVSAARFAEVRELMRQRFPAGDGFELRIETRRESRRLLEQGPAGRALAGGGVHDRGTERWLMRWIACA